MHSVSVSMMSRLILNLHRQARATHGSDWLASTAPTQLEFRVFTLRQVVDDDAITIEIPDGDPPSPESLRFSTEEHKMGTVNVQMP